MAAAQQKQETHPSRSPISPSASTAGEYSSAVLETIAGHKLVTSTLSNDVKQGIALTLSIAASTAVVQQVRKAAKFLGLGNRVSANKGEHEERVREETGFHLSSVSSRKCPRVQRSKQMKGSAIPRGMPTSALCPSPGTSATAYQASNYPCRHISERKIKEAPEFSESFEEWSCKVQKENGTRHVAVLRRRLDVTECRKR